MSNKRNLYLKNADCQVGQRTWRQFWWDFFWMVMVLEGFGLAITAMFTFGGQLVE